MGYRLKALGSADLRGPEGARVGSVLAQPKRLCLLTYLALAPEPVSRATLAALFWPDSDEGRARNALSQAVHYLRRSTTKGVVESQAGDRLWVPPELLWCDARELLHGSLEPDHHDGSPRTLLEGWNADDSQPLQEWLDGMRRDLHARAEARSVAHPSPPEPVAHADEPIGVTPAVTGVGPVPPSASGRRPGRRTSVARPRHLGLGAVAIVVFVLGARAFSGGPASAADGLVDGEDAALGSPAGAAESAAPLPTLVVRRPIWASTPPEGLSPAIMAEVIASLNELGTIQVRDASFLPERADDVDRLLDALGEPREPDYMLRIVLTLSGAELRAQTSLTGPTGIALGDDRVELPFQDHTALVWGAPDSVAGSVVDVVRHELAERRPSP